MVAGDHAPAPVGNRSAVVVDGVRTPFARSFGAFGASDALGLLCRVVDGLVRRVDAPPDAYDEIRCGVVTPQPKNPNVARDTVIALGLPSRIHGTSVNRMCASSLETIAEAARSIHTGDARMVIAGGVDVLSDVPISYSRSARRELLRIRKARSAWGRAAAFGRFTFRALTPKPPSVTEPLTGMSMGEHAEAMARRHGIGRGAQDEFALRSHRLAAAAAARGVFAAEIVPVWPEPGYEPCIEADDVIRADASLDALARLKPSFDKTHGTVTAGNASPLTDGAAVVVVADEAFARGLGLRPKARIRDAVFVGVDPFDELLIGPAVAIPALLDRNRLAIADIDRFEIHEAFAAQVLSCLEALESPAFGVRHLSRSGAYGTIPLDRVNVNGGAIAIGHPFGATGARLVLTLADELRRCGGRYGVIAICAAGGMAGAMLVESFLP